LNAEIATTTQVNFGPGPGLGRDLADEFRPGHIYGAVDGSSLRPRIVFQISTINVA